MLENAMRNIVINGRPVNLERAEQNEHAGKPRKKKQRDRDRESRAAQVPFWENRRHRPYHKNKKS